MCVCNLQAVIPGTLTTVMPIVRGRLDGLVSRTIPCASEDALKQQAIKTKRSRKSRRTVSLLHAKTKTRIACWNVRTLGSLNKQSEKLTAALKTIEEG